MAELTAERVIVADTAGYSSKSFTVAMPMCCDAETAAALEQNMIFDAKATVRATGDAYFPYELVAETLWTTDEECDGFGYCDSFEALEYGEWPYACTLISVSVSTDDGGDGTTLLLHDGEGAAAKLKKDPAAQRLMQLLPGYTDTDEPLHISDLYAVRDPADGELLFVPAATSTLIYFPALKPESMSVPVGTTLEKVISLVSIVDHYSGEPICSAGDADFGYEQGDYDPDTPGWYEVPIEYEGEPFGDLLVEVCQPAHYTSAETGDFLRLDDLSRDEGYEPPQLSAYTVGNDTRILVIPIAFRDNDGYSYRHLDAQHTLTGYLDDCFNDETEKTDWYSLRAYYQAVSYGALRLRADILEPYLCDYSVEEAVALGNVGTIVEAALAYYDGQIDYALYDNDGDGDIDCPYFIYLGPYEEGSEVLWGFNSQISTERAYDGEALVQYIWMSLDFFDEPFRDDGSGTSDVQYANCGVLIHETGHALGLEDYYSRFNIDVGFDLFPNMGNLTAGTELMDCSAGSLTAYSRLLLGWTDPEVFYFEGGEAELLPLETSGDVVVVARQDEGTVFGEYFTISLYTPTGPNSIDCDRGEGLFTESGVVIYHITSELKETYWETVGPMDFFDGKTHIRLLRNNAAKPYPDRMDNAENPDLFQEGDSVTLCWDGGAPAMTVRIDSADGNGAHITLTLP